MATDNSTGNTPPPWLRPARVLPRTLPAAYLAAVSADVAAAERPTRAEIVVAIRHCSGNYRDVDYLFGVSIAMLRLLYFVAVPWHIHEYRVLIELPLLFAGAAWLCAWLPLRRWLTTARRRDAQVQTAAAACFVADNVSHTRARTGVLLYWSMQEKQVRVLADLGIAAAVPGAEWSAWQFQFQQVPHTADPARALRTAIRTLGELLARHLPADADNPDELPNHPRAQA